MTVDVQHEPAANRAAWRRLAFGDIVENVTNRVDDPSRAGVERYVGLEHLDPGSLRIRRWGSPSDVEATKLVFRSGDVIFGRRRAYQRKLAQADFDGICSAHAMVVRVRPDVVLPEFLPLLMQTDYFYERSLAISVGSLSPTINWKAMAREQFDVPPLVEQRRIAPVVREADHVAEGWESVSERAATSVMSTLIDSLAQRGWPEHSCKDLLVSGPQNGLSVPANTEQRGMPTLSLGAVQRGRIVPEGHTKWADVDAARVAQYFLNRHDVLVVRGNGNLDLTARCGMVEDMPQQYFYPDLLIRLVFDEDRIRAPFAALQWNSPLVQRVLKRRAKSTNGIWKVNGKDVAQQKLYVPPVEEQDAFLSRAGQLQRLADEAAERQRLTAELRHRLLERFLG